jgi:hypothetical protein
MMKRPVWLVTGVALGVGGTLWAEQRVRRVLRTMTPDNVARGTVDRVRGALDAARDEVARRENELWAELEGRQAPSTSAAGTRARAARREVPRRRMARR